MSTYGLARDFSERINAPGYCPFTAAKTHAPSYEFEYVRGDKGRFVKAIKRAVARVNPETHWCQPSPLTVQEREIKRARKG